MSTSGPLIEPAGPPKCIHCGYDLRGRENVTKCPECGEVNWIVRNRILAQGGTGYGFAATTIGVIAFFASAFSIMLSSHSGPVLPFAIVVGPAALPVFFIGRATDEVTAVLLFGLICMMCSGWYALLTVTFLKAFDLPKGTASRWRWFIVLVAVHTFAAIVILATPR